jgi:hypothetical protein
MGVPMKHVSLVTVRGSIKKDRSHYADKI